MEKISINYQFIFPGGQKKDFPMFFEKDSMLFIPGSFEIPAWALLKNHQCSNCTLSTDETEYCPVSVNIVPLFEWSSNLVSHENITIQVINDKRTISMVSTIQRAVSSMLGLIMASSSCPHTLFLRPMARFHLPVATQEETVYRATSMYLLAQFTIQHFGSGKADFTLNKLKALYKNLQIINSGMANRLREVSVEDAASNAVTLLDLYAKGVNYSADDRLDDLKYIFNEYLTGAVPSGSDI